MKNSHFLPTFIPRDAASHRRDENENKAVYTSRSRVRVGRGSDDKGLPKHLGRSSNAKTARNAEKAKCDRPTDRRTDRRTDRPTDTVTYRVACTRLKMNKSHLMYPRGTCSSKKLGIQTEVEDRRDRKDLRFLC